MDWEILYSLISYWKEPFTRIAEIFIDSTSIRKLDTQTSLRVIQCMRVHLETSFGSRVKETRWYNKFQLLSFFPFPTDFSWFGRFINNSLAKLIWHLPRRIITRQTYPWISCYHLPRTIDQITCPPDLSSRIRLSSTQIFRLPPAMTFFGHVCLTAKK